MKCRDFEVLLSAYADGELAQTQRDFIEEHLAGCTQCRARLAQYQQTGKQLTSLQTAMPMTDIKETTMSRIKSETMLGKTRHWLRPVLSGVSAAVVLMVLLAIFALPARAPANVLAQAVASTMDLKSYRVSDTAFQKNLLKNEWITNLYSDTEYAGPGHIHNKARYLSSVTETENWETFESIVSDNTAYYWSSTPSYFSLEMINERFSKEITSLQRPMDSLKILANINKLPDEEIDGITCRHYQGLVDMDAWLQQFIALHKEMNPNSPPEILKFIEEMWRNQFEITYNFWIGKSDNLLHQWGEVFSIHPWGAVPSNKSDMKMTANEQSKEIFRYYDFNAEIVIEPPLDSNGNLLPDWRIQSEP